MKLIRRFHASLFSVLLLLTVHMESTTVADEPVKVFILAGQSNMVGHGKTRDGLNPAYDPDQPQSADNRREIPDGIGGLAWAVKTMPETFGPNGTDPLVDANGEWIVRDDVSVYSRIEVFKDKNNPGELTEGRTEKGRHTVGFGKGNWNGPEYGFGHVVGNALEHDVLIIKVATGGTSLRADWRSPTAVAKRGGEVGYMWPHMLRTVEHVLNNLGTEFPEFSERTYEFAGFGWHQGWNDRTQQGVAEYEANLVDLILDVRKEFGEKLPIVIANTGIGGSEVQGVGLELIQAQGAVADFEKYPSHKGNVAVVDTRPMYRDKSVSPSGFGYHWNHNGITHYEIGAGMGQAYLKLADSGNEYAAKEYVEIGIQSLLWKNPDYATDLRATQAESRPGPDEDPKSWNLWMRHHNDRKRWCAEQDVDLLMVGDSIVFRWSRTGRPVWEEFYADRKAVNIGSSGDRTYHMLWHFQNGGLDGMKDRNPKLVVVMIGTNNRGEVEKQGADTAYGILALLKEIHARLPESKILLMAIFPRDDKPDSPGRVRNDDINAIIKDYADNETVFWLDISDVFLNEDGTLNRELMPDALHPNVDGYRAWAKAMEPTLQRLLDEESK